MSIEIDLDSLKEIYLISNTASFLYSGFSKEESLIELKEMTSQDELIIRFDKISKSKIEKVEELVLAYAVYVVILLFNNEKTVNFLALEGNINFEWFPELKQMYLSRLKSFNYNTLEIKDFQTNHSKSYVQSSNEINNQIIEF